MSQTSYQMGPLHFEVRGNGALCAAVRDELTSILSTAAEPDIIFDFSAPTACAGDATISKPIMVRNGCYQASHSLLRYVAASQVGSSLIVNVAADMLNVNSITRFLKNVRILNWNHLSLTEVIAKNFIYNVFDYWTQIALLGRDATYIHASAIEKQGTALLLAGRGGVGKSSFMLKSILEDNYRYLSDDLIALDVSSTIWRTPKKIQIYAYNTANEPIIRNALLKGRSWADRAAWHTRALLKSGKRVRRRVAAERLFGPTRLAESATVGRAIFLERHTSNDVSVTEICGKEFAYRCATLLLEELNPFISISLAEHSANDAPILPSIADMLTTTRQLMERGLEMSELIHICVPEHFSPTELNERLKPYLP